MYTVYNEDLTFINQLKENNFIVWETITGTNYQYY